MWKFSSKCQKKPRWSEFRDSVLTMFTQRSQPLAPSVDNYCLQLYEQRRVELQQCSCVQLQLFPSLQCHPTCGIQAAMFDPQHEDFIPQFISCSQARLTGLFSQSSQPSLHTPARRKTQAAQPCVLDIIWRPRRICRAVVFPDEEGAACRGFRFTLPRMLRLPPAKELRRAQEHQ